MVKLFPKRPKLKVIFKGALKGKSPEVFIFTDMKDLKAKIAWFKAEYESKTVKFIQVPGMIEIRDKPPELVGTDFVDAADIGTIFSNAPKWAEKKETIWGQGFEDTWYVATPTFTNVVKLKKL